MALSSEALAILLDFYSAQNTQSSADYLVLYLFLSYTSVARIDLPYPLYYAGYERYIHWVTPVLCKISLFLFWVSSLRWWQGNQIKLNSSTPFTPTYVLSTALVSTQHYQSRIRGRQLFLENPARDSRFKKERAEKAVKRRSENSRSAAGLISIRNARQKGLWRLSATEAK